MFKRYWIDAFDWYGHGGMNIQGTYETIEEAMERLKTKSQVTLDYANRANIIYIQDDMTPQTLACYKYMLDPKRWEQTYAHESLSEHLKHDTEKMNT